MKKRNIAAAAGVILVLATGCSMQGGALFSQANDTSAAGTEAALAPSSSEADLPAEDKSTITGTISDIKDFMFVITDEAGVDYPFSFDGKKPEGLDSVKDGDTVMVVYTGELQTVEAFTGTVISVTKKQA